MENGDVLVMGGGIFSAVFDRWIGAAAVIANLNPASSPDGL